MEKIYDVVIIGGGPGGYTSALYCARAGLSTMVLEKLSAGGQMALTSQIDNYPGFEEGIDGFSLAEKMEQGAERFGAETELAEVLSVDFSNDIKIVESSEGTFKAKTVIIATGAVPRELGVPGQNQSRSPPESSSVQKRLFLTFLWKRLRLMPLPSDCKCHRMHKTQSEYSLHPAHIPV